MINIRPVPTHEQALDEAVRRMTTAGQHRGLVRMHDADFPSAAKRCFAKYISAVRAEYHRIMVEAA